MVAAVDIRGSDWLAKQDWSSGRVGMFGISWGGFNAIQMAARDVPALQVIIAIDATEDLYQNDVHYMGGILRVDSWEMSMDLDNARPGAPDDVIDDGNFRDRFDTEPWTLSHKRRQRDGPYWDAVVLWEAELDFRSDRERFYYSYHRRLSENGKPVREKTWTETIPRDHQ